MENKVKKIPYGISDYERVIADGYYYVDKTMYIEKIELSPSFLFLVRPRRFGKSLFLSMISDYYDINKAQRFEALFGDQYIYNHPTQDRGKYLILSFNFSMVNSDPNFLRDSFEEHCSEQCDAFANKYEHLFTANFKKVYQTKISSGARIQYLARMCSENNLHIYVIIDEYDKFASNILSTEGHQSYHQISHGAGFYRSFFSILKGITTGSGAAVQRMLIMGVSPITLDDLTSGFNIGSNITLEPKYNGVIGFSENELHTMLSYFKKQGCIEHSVEEMIETMRPWYNNYCFAEECLGDNMYNSDMALFYLDSYINSKKIILKNMVDKNIQTDYNQLRKLAAWDAENTENFSAIQELIDTGQTAATINISFPAESIIDTSNFKSLLFYFGMVSIAGVSRGEVILKIPNLVVQEQLFRYLIEGYKSLLNISINIHELAQKTQAMAYDGEWKPVFDLISSKLQEASVVREFIEGEAHVKGFMLAYLGLTSHFIIHPEYEASKGYADFYFQANFHRHPEMKHRYIVEIKYLKRDAKDIDIVKAKEDAKQQLQRYAADPKVKNDKGDAQLHLVAVVFKGWEVVDSFTSPLLSS